MKNQSNLFTFENVLKLCLGLIALCGAWYGFDNRLSLMEQKLDYYIAINEGKEHEAKLVVAELKAEDKEINSELQDLKERLIKVCAVLPKKWYGKVEEVSDEQNN